MQYRVNNDIVLDGVVRNNGEVVELTEEQAVEFGSNVVPLEVVVAFEATEVATPDVADDEAPSVEPTVEVVEPETTA